MPAWLQQGWGVLVGRLVGMMVGEGMGEMDLGIAVWGTRVLLGSAGPGMLIGVGVSAGNSPALAWDVQAGKARPMKIRKSFRLRSARVDAFNLSVFKIHRGVRDSPVHKKCFLMPGSFRSSFKRPLRRAGRISAVQRQT